MHLFIKKGEEEISYFTAVYSCPHQSGRKLLWSGLTHVANSVDRAWLIAGYFNALLNDSERRGG